MKTGFLFLLQSICLLTSCVQILRAIGAFYHVWKKHNVQKARSEMRRSTTHALYRSKLWQQDHCKTSKCIAGLPRITGTYPGWWKQSFWLRLLSLMWFQVRATSCHLTSSKSAWKSTPKCIWICWRVWWSPWCNQVAGGRPWVWQQDSVPSHKSKETQGWLQKACYDFVPFSHCPLLPRPEPAGLLRLVIRREHHQHDLPQHQSQPDQRHPPSIRWAPAGACGNGMLLVPDTYRGGDRGWRWLHWIDVSSST